MRHSVLFYESHSGFFDGAQQSLFLLLKHLDRRRFHPIFVGPEEGLLTRQLTEAGVETIIARPDDRFSRYGGAMLHDNVWRKGALLFPYLAYTWRLRKIIKETRAQVVHCNSIRSLLTVGPAARIVRVPLIWHLRLNLNLGEWNRVGRKLADQIVVVSDSLREHFPDGPGDPAQFVTVHNGLDLTRFTPEPHTAGAREQLRIGPDWQAVGMVGSITPRKGQLDLLQAALRVIQARPQTIFVIVGEAQGPEGHAYFDRLRTYVASEGLDRHIVFTGWHSDVIPILRQLNLLALPSLNEGLPRVILEAMALSLPVVATNVGGNAELVRDGHTGLLVPPQDPHALAAAMMLLLQNPDLAHTMGRQGRQRVERDFSLGASVRGVETVIESLLAGRRSAWRASGPRFTETSQARE